MGRQFYVSGEDDEVDQKCHDMLTCFVFNLYQGVRAGGGIGDVIEPADGDDSEVYRILFDISFFFFIIVILLAIIQGFIIDAFGALRDQMQGVDDELENNCFICGIGKDYLDNYLFFLMYLINKDETEYTGQETYVWDMYKQRCWDFFPLETASENNTSPSSRVVVVVNESKKSLKIFPSKISLLLL